MEEIRLQKIYEDFFDDWAPEQITNAKEKVAQNDDVVYIPGDPDKFKYYMTIRLEIEASWKSGMRDEDYVLDLGEMYEDVAYVCRTTLIDGNFYITPMRFWDENKSKDDYQNYMFRIEPIQFEFPYPKEFSFKEIYKGNFKSSLNCPRFEFRIYFNDVCYYPFKTFISRWRMMMQALLRAVKQTKAIRSGEITQVNENVEHPAWNSVSCMYLNGYNHHYDTFVKLYKMFFNEDAPEYDGDDDNGNRNQATDRMLRRMRLEELAKRTELANGKDPHGISVEYCQSEFRNHGDRGSTAWVSFKVHTDRDRLDITAVEEFLLKNFLIKIPAIYYHHVEFCVFLKSDFTGPNIFSSNDNRIKEHFKRRSSYSSEHIFRGEPYEAHEERLSFYVDGNRKREDRFREFWFDSMGSSSKFLIYFGDKNGKLGKTFFFQKRYTGYTPVDKFKDVLEKIDDDVDIWAKK